MSRWSLGRKLDLVEQIAVLLLYSFMLSRLWPDDFSRLQYWFPILLLVSEGFVMVFVLVRRPTNRISCRPHDWIIAFAGTVFPLLVIPGGPPILGNTGPFLMIMGIIVHVGAKFSLRRSFGVVAADRGIKATGAYRYVRHPMYVGYFLTHVGYLLVAPRWWNVGVYAVTWCLLVIRVFAEERVLSANAEYKAYMAKVPHRLIPFIF